MPNQLRKYVMYTWGCNTMNEDHIHSQKGSTCGSFMISSTSGKGTFPFRVSSRKQKLQNKKDTISFNKKVSLPDEMNTTLEHTRTLELKSFTTGTASSFDRRLSSSTIEPSLKHDEPGSANRKGKRFIPSKDTVALKHQALSLGDEIIPPPPPSLDLKDDSEVQMSDIKKNFQHLYDYNVMLRQKFVETQSSLHALASKKSLSPGKEGEKWHVG